MRLCTTCGVEKELDAFHNYKKGPQGKAYRCKECDSIAGKAYKARQCPKRMQLMNRARLLRFKYGIEVEDYDNMWGDQEGRCRICDTNLVNINTDGDPKNKSNTACVDHCHVSGRARGILCSTCNKGLGLFYDRVDLLEKAIKYLK